MRRTPALVAKAKELREAGYLFTEIGERLGFNDTTIIAWLSPERARKREEDRRRRDYTYVHNVVERKPSEADYMARLAEIPPDTRNLSQRLMGEPVPGRSALDRKQA